jgi:hypothetical protein
MRFMATFSEELGIDRYTILEGGFNPGLEKTGQEARIDRGHPLQRTYPGAFVA